MRRSLNKMNQIKALGKAMGLQHLIDEAYHILGNPIMLYDSKWRILAYAKDAVTDAPTWNNHINDGTIEANIDAFINSGIIDIITGADRVVILNRDHLKYSRIFGKIFGQDYNLMVEVSIVVSGFWDIVYRGLKNNLYLAVADVSRCNHLCTKLEYYRVLFKEPVLLLNIPYIQVA